MAVLLTGASGFVGRNLLRVLRERGEAVVPFEGNVCSEADLGRAFAAAPIERVLHAAAVTPDAAAEAARPEAAIEVNLLGTVRVMEAARRAGVSRVLALSSVAAYGAADDANGLDEESTVPWPVSLYGTTKLALEGVVRRLGELGGIATTTVRLGPCFGVGEHPTGVRPLMSPHWQCAEAAWAGRDCVIPRELAGDWIDVEDAARALADLLAVPEPGAGPFNLGGGAVTTVAAWCEALAGLRPGFRWRIDPAAPTVRHGVQRDRPAMSTRRLRAAIGWAPDTADLAGRAARYLAWRGGAEGRALCDGKGE